MQQNYYVYILTNDPRDTVLYIGVTNDLHRRLWEHTADRGSEFAREYNAGKLIYFEAYSDPRSAIAREKQLKNWSRKKKETLIANQNPEWRDLLAEMTGPLTDFPKAPRDPSTTLRFARDDGAF